MVSKNGVATPAAGGATATAEEEAFGPARFADGPALRLAGLRQRYTFDTMEAIPAQWGRFAPHIGTTAARVGRADYGVVLGSPDGNGFDYVTAFEVGEGAELPAGFATLEIPARRYAVFGHDGPAATLCVTIDRIFSRWLPESGYAPAGPPDFFERYGENFDPERGAGDLEVWVPVQRRTA